MWLWFNAQGQGKLILRRAWPARVWKISARLGILFGVSRVWWFYFWLHTKGNQSWFINCNGSSILWISSWLRRLSIEQLLSLWSLNIIAYSIYSNQSKQFIARRRLGVFVLLYTDRHLSTYHVRNKFKFGYGEFFPSFWWHQCRGETQWSCEFSLCLFLKMANSKSIFLGPFLPSTRNCPFAYFCRRLSQVSLIWSDVYCFLWWILYINSCLSLFLHHKSLGNEYIYHIMESWI